MNKPTISSAKRWHRFIASTKRKTPRKTIATDTATITMATVLETYQIGPNGMMATNIIAAATAVYKIANSRMTLGVVYRELVAKSRQRKWQL